MSLSTVALRSPKCATAYLGRCHQRESLSLSEPPSVRTFHTLRPRRSRSPTYPCLLKHTQTADSVWLEPGSAGDEDSKNRRSAWWIPS